MNTDTPFAARRARPATPASPATVAAVAFACLAAGVGCARQGVDVTTAAVEKLTPAATAYVAVPEDGRFGTKVYTGSGLEVAALVAEALSSRLRRVVIAEGEQAPAAALAGARAAGFTYLIQPSILRWEDQPTAWSGGADRAKILLEAVDTTTGVAADVAVVEGRGGPDTATLQGAAETPSALLEPALAAYAERLLRAPAATAAR